MHDFIAEYRILEWIILSSSANSFVNTKPKQQLVLQAYEKYGRSRIALTARAPAQLVVDPHTFVHMRTHHIQPAQLGDCFCLYGVTAA
ncbi:hypothetical protein D3C85_1536960 [compost metagenome]